MAEKEKGKLKKLVEDFKEFVTKDIWSFDIRQKGPLRRAIGNTIKVIVIAVRTFLDDKIMTKAAALTYSTLFAIVPILALIFAVGRGFGFGNIFDMMKESGVIDLDKVDGLDSVMTFIDGYMQYVSSGAFVGIGLLFLLFTVYSLADGPERRSGDIHGIGSAVNGREANFGRPCRRQQFQGFHITKIANYNSIEISSSPSW